MIKQSETEFEGTIQELVVISNMYGVPKKDSYQMGLSSPKLAPASWFQMSFVDRLSPV